MNIAARLLSVVVVAAVAVAIVYGVSQVRQVATVKLDDEKAFVDAHPTGIVGQNLGSAGCMGAACHGGPAVRKGRDGKLGGALTGQIDDGTWQSSGSCWVAADPHTDAYALLTTTKKDQESGRIKVSAEHIMGLYAPGTKATDDARCLACHTNPALAEPGKTDDPRTLSLRAEGVSCEACHGSAGGWIRQHTTWTGKRDKVYDETGMSKLYDLGQRALACAGCHVGAPAAGGFAVRDMNHDMIAAGHPRLDFDFAEYQRRLPVHWQEKDRDSGGAPRSVDPVKAWLLGRVAHAEAACKLTEDRARRSAADPRTPWPEFGEYNCAACHHHLTAGWRGQVLEDRPPGAPPWQSVWPITPAIGLSPQIPADLFAQAGARPLPAVKRLVKAMQAPRLPGAAKVRPDAKAAAAALAGLRAELVAWPDARFGPEAAKAFTGPAAGAQDWDSGVQLLFGLAALERSRLRGGPPDAARDEWFRDAFGAYRGPPETETRRWDKMQASIRKLYPKN